MSYSLHKLPIISFKASAIFSNRKLSQTSFEIFPLLIDKDIKDTINFFYSRQSANIHRYTSWKTTSFKVNT